MTATTRSRAAMGPTGIGTSAARIRPRTGTVVPQLYCPPPVRDDPVLADAINEGLIAWAQDIGLYSNRLDEIRATQFGRLIMLTHPDAADPDRLLAAGKCAFAEWASDDYYCDDSSAGAVAVELGPRLAVATSAIDPVHMPGEYGAQLAEHLDADPVLRALRTSHAHVGRYASPTQMARLRYETERLFIGYLAEAGWKLAQRTPPVWEYLSNRQINSFLPMVALIDVVGGYELTAGEYIDPRVRRVVAMTSAAGTIQNDLYSMARENGSADVDFNLPTIIAIEQRCTQREGLERAAELHDELVRTVEQEAATLAATGTPALGRYLAGLWAWLGGCRAWHASSARYNSTTNREGDS